MKWWSTWSVERSNVCREVLFHEIAGQLATTWQYITLYNIVEFSRGTNLAYITLYTQHSSIAIIQHCVKFIKQEIVKPSSQSRCLKGKVV